MSSLQIKKTKALTRTIKGVIFFPTEIPKKFYPGIQAWVEDKCPDHATVYDHADHLISCGIDIVDAVVYRGTYIRVRDNLKVKEKELRILPLTTSRLLLATPKLKVKAIQVANTQEHHKLNR